MYKSVQKEMLTKRCVAGTKGQYNVKNQYTDDLFLQALHKLTK